MRKAEKGGGKEISRGWESGAEGFVVLDVAWNNGRGRVRSINPLQCAMFQGWAKWEYCVWGVWLIENACRWTGGGGSGSSGDIESGRL